MLADLAYPDCEQALPKYISIGKNASAKRVAKHMSLLTPGMVPLCFDYEDFNSQHSTESMRAVLAAYRCIHADDMTMQQLNAALWTECSLDNMIISENRSLGLREYKAAGTLLSGWRLTTMVNSVLNRVYLEWAGCLDHAVAAVHSGDDVFVATTSIAQAETFLRKARSAGIRAQPAKAATGSIAEFLRVEHRTGATGAQYLPRACATLVHSRIESRQALSLQTALDAVAMRTDEMLDRGAEPRFMSAATTLLEEKLCTMVFNTPIEVATAYRRLHPLEGGTGWTPDPTGTRVVTEVKARAELDDGKYAPIVEYMIPGMYDLARWFARLVPAKLDTGHLIHKMALATERSLVRVRRKVELERYPVTKYEIENYVMYKAWAPLVAYGLGNIMKGFDPTLVALAAGVKDQTLMCHVASMKDPLKRLHVFI
jgi:hypothetical protein